MVDKLQADIERVKEALAEPIPDPSPRRGARRVMVKKVKKVEKSNEATEGKKAAKKASAKKANGKDHEAKAADPNVVTIAQLASEAGIGAQSARVKLRESQVERPEGRWVWAVGSKSLKEARKVLGLS